MGSCENLVEVSEPLNNAAIQQHYCLELAQNTDSEQLPCSETCHNLIGSDVKPTHLLNECLELSEKDNVDCVNCSDGTETASVDRTIGLMGEIENGVILLPWRLLDDDCGVNGGQSDERRSGKGHCYVETDGLIVEKLGFEVENDGQMNSLENVERSLEGQLDERKSGKGHCYVETDGLIVEKLGFKAENDGQMNSLENGERSLESMAVPSSPGHGDRQDDLKDDKGGSVLGVFEEKSNDFSVIGTSACAQVVPSDCEMPAEVMAVNGLVGNSVEQDIQEESGIIVERAVMAMENNRFDLASTEIDGHKQIPSELKPITVLPSNIVQQEEQQDLQTISFFSAGFREVMGEKVDVLSGTKTTNCCQESVELKPATSSPEKGLHQDWQKDKPVSFPALEEVVEVVEKKSDLLPRAEAVMNNQMLSSVDAQMCVEAVAFSGLIRDCPQQGEMVINTASDLAMESVVNGKIDASARIKSFRCTYVSSHCGNMPPSDIVSGCDWQDGQANAKSVGCLSAEIVPEDIETEIATNKCIQVLPSQACQRTLETSRTADVLGNCSQKNEQRNYEHVDGPLLESMLEVVEEKSDFTTDIKVKFCSQKLCIEENSDDSKVPSSSIEKLASLQSGQPFGVVDNASFKSLDVPNISGLGANNFSSAIESSGLMDTEVKDHAGIGCIPETSCPDFVSKSCQRSSQIRKSSRKTQTKKTARKNRKTAKAPNTRGLVEIIFKHGRRKRSFFSKQARSSMWGLLENVTRHFMLGNGPQLDPIQNYQSGKAAEVNQESKKKKKNRASGNSRRSSGKSSVLAGCIRLKVKVGKNVAQNSQNSTIPEIIDATASVDAFINGYGTIYQGTSFEVANASSTEDKVGEDGTVKHIHEFENKLEKEKTDSDASVVDVHLAKDAMISEKSAADAEHNHGIHSHLDVEGLGAANEKSYTDPGTSPDSEVINLPPEGQFGATYKEDFHDTTLTVPQGGCSGKRGKKKGHIHPGSNLLEDRSPGMSSIKNVKQTKKHGGRKKKGNDLSSSEIRASSISANASSNSLCNKEFSVEQSTLLSGNEIQKESDRARKGKSKVPGSARRRRANGCRLKGNECKSVIKKKDKDRVVCDNNSYMENPEIEDSGKTPFGDVLSMNGAHLDMTSTDAVGQDIPVINAWVSCDDCQKWRRIPVDLVEAIENCRWVCKDNVDKTFAYCSFPQEKSNAEINAELGFDSDEDACNVSSDDKGLESRHNTDSKEHEFTRISTNQYLHRSRKNQTIDEIMVCHCKPPIDGRPGCGDECLNRMLNIECVQGTCPCGDLCSNQQFQKHNYARMNWDRCGKKGFGLRLEENISKGQFLIEYVGEVLDMRAYEARQKEYASKGHKHFYFMTLDGSEVIDACTKGNLGRFINHSCDPNCRTEKWVVNGEICIGLFALRDIKKGEEVTFDYNFVRVVGAAAKKCYCGSSQCGGYIGGDPTNTEVIDQVDSDEEFPEPVMLEDGESGNQFQKPLSRTISFDDVEVQIVDVSKDSHKRDDAIGAVGTLEGATAIKGEINQPASAISLLHSSLKMEHSKGQLPPSQTVEISSPEDSTCKLTPTVQQEIPMEDNMGKTSFSVQRLEMSESTMLSKPASDGVAANKKPKSATAENKRGSRILIKTSHWSGSLKKGKIPCAPNANKVQITVNKSQVLSIKPKKLVEGTPNSHFEAVEEKLNELLDAAGGISKRKDATKGYLKLLLLTAASGASGNGEGIQSNRELSMILDALLKTRSKVVLMDIINKNGLRMLHNMMKQYRRDFKKIPILRKLLKVLEYLAVRKILTLVHISGGPPCPGMESFIESMLSFTEHDDKQVHQIARSFRDRWIPRHMRKFNHMDREDGRLEFHKGSSYNRDLASHNHWRDQSVLHVEATDSVTQPKLATSVDIPVNEAGSASSIDSGTKTRKRKSRWDQPAEEKPARKCLQKNDQKIESELSQQSKEDSCPNCAHNYHRQEEPSSHDAKQNLNGDAPPGFSSPFNCTPLSSNTSSTVIDQPQQNVGHLNSPVGVSVGHLQQKFMSRLPVSYGIPLPMLQQFGSPQSDTVEGWVVAPGMPFHPFPPLPPFPHQKKEIPLSCGVNSMAIDETAQGQQNSNVPSACNANENNPNKTGANQADMDILGSNGGHKFKRTRRQPYDLGRRFRQQKCNKLPPCHYKGDNYGYIGNNARGGMWNPDIGHVTSEYRNSCFPQDVSFNKGAHSNYFNQQGQHINEH